MELLLLVYLHFLFFCTSEENVLSATKFSLGYLPDFLAKSFKALAVDRTIIGGASPSHTVLAKVSRSLL